MMIWLGTRSQTRTSLPARCAFFETASCEQLTVAGWRHCRSKHDVTQGLKQKMGSDQFKSSNLLWRDSLLSTRTVAGTLLVSTAVRSLTVTCVNRGRRSG